MAKRFFPFLFAVAAGLGAILGVFQGNARLYGVSVYPIDGLRPRAWHFITSRKTHVNLCPPFFEGNCKTVISVFSRSRISSEQ